MDPASFEKLVAQVIAELPERLREAMDNVSVVVEPVARPALKRETGIDHGGVLLGLYQGIPKSQWGRSESGVLPDKITIFQKPIERLARDEASLKELVREVVWHEIGHHFGFNDAELRQMEKRRGKEQKKI